MMIPLNIKEKIERIILKILFEEKFEDSADEIAGLLDDEFHDAALVDGRLRVGHAGYCRKTAGCRRLSPSDDR
ncbi:MAG: hypothetical protein ACFFDF_21575, partial [Candidatus Odinarchaeota archaeon]